MITISNACMVRCAMNNDAYHREVCIRQLQKNKHKMRELSRATEVHCVTDKCIHEQPMCKAVVRQMRAILAEDQRLRDTYTTLLAERELE